MILNSRLLANGHFVILALLHHSFFTSITTTSAFSTRSNIGFTLTVKPQTRTSHHSAASSSAFTPFHPFTFNLSKHQDGNMDDIDDDGSLLQKLTLLFDEAILLHSKVESSKNDEVQSLIENIAAVLQMDKNDESIKNVNLNLIEPMKKKEEKKRRTVEEVRYELDQAVINLQRLAVHDEEEKWTQILPEQNT